VSTDPNWSLALSPWDSYGLADYELGAGNTSEDSRSRWYINISMTLGPQYGTRGSEATNTFLQTPAFVVEQLPRAIDD
jgi:hypothetical protein